jgi:transketolase
MTTEELRAKPGNCAMDVAAMIGPEKVGHLGGSCSLEDIVTALYYQVMRLRPMKPDLGGHGPVPALQVHAARIQYAALGDLGYFPKGEEATLKTLGSRCQGHPDMRKSAGN